MGIWTHTSLTFEDESGIETEIESSLEVATTVGRIGVINQCKHTSGKNGGVGWTPGNHNIH